MTLNNGQYIITEDEILNNSEITADELVEIYGERLEFNLILASRKAYNIMYSAYRGVNKDRQRLVLNYMIAEDTALQTAMMEATIEYMRGAMYTGMDLNEYVGQKPSYSKSVIDILKQNELWIVAQIDYRDSDIEWENHVILNTQ